MMEEEVKKYSILYRNQPPYEVLGTKWLSYDEIILLKGVEELVELYYNSGQYTLTLKYAVPFLRVHSASMKCFQHGIGKRLS